MSTLIDYNWTQGRSVQAAGSSAPATGQWYRDDSDPSFVFGTTWVYLALPFWLALDFQHTKTGGLLALVSGPTDDGTRGRLRIYRGAEGEPATLTDYVELEANEVSGAALGVRGSGEVDVFYIHNGTLKYRKSDDGGVTFGSATSISLAGAGGVAFIPKAASGTIAASFPNGTFMHTEDVGGYVHFDYLAGGGLALLVHGRLTGAVTGDTAHIVRADWDGSAWVFQTLALGTGIGIGPIQALRTGDLFAIAGCKKIKGLSNTGAFTLQYTAGGGQIPGGVSEAWNQHLSTLVDTSDVSDGSGFYRRRRLMGSALNSAQTTWALTGSVPNANEPEILHTWTMRYLRSTSPGVFSSAGSWATKAGRARMRRDGRWEYLYLNRWEQPEIIRFKKITAAVTPLEWY